MKIAVVVHPNSKKPRIEEDLMKVLHVYVSAPPLNGKANREVVEVLAKYFKTKKSNVFLIRGERIKHKVFKIITTAT